MRHWDKKKEMEYYRKKKAAFTRPVKQAGSGIIR